jgi:hypothetical protein
MGNAGFSTWSAAVKQKLMEFGIRVSDIESLVDGEPVIIMGRPSPDADRKKTAASITRMPRT